MSIKYDSNIDKVKKAIEEAEERALLAISEYVRGEASLRCPVDTGNLRGSIDYKINTSEKETTIGTPVEYAVYVEKGTSRQTEQPFLTPAIEDNKETIKKIVKEEMGKLD
jgi:HK97 gp10 family phage protein